VWVFGGFDDARVGPKVYRGVANRAITDKDLQAGHFVEMGTAQPLLQTGARSPDVASLDSRHTTLTPELSELEL